jgi:putative ABC transport system permease protein
VVPGLQRQAVDPMADTTRLTDSFHLNLTAFGLLSFAVGLFIVQGAIGLAFQQRRPMFRTLRALGLPLRRLVGLLTLELLGLALIAGAIGLALGYGIAAALLPDVAASLRGLYGAPVEGSLSLRPAWAVSGFGMALLGTLLAGAQGLWQLTRLPLLSAPGSAAWQGGNARLARGMALLGLALLIAGPMAVWLFDGLLAGFALLGGLLLGAALILPYLLHLLLGWIAARSTGPVAQWVWADMRAQVPGLSLALMALLLALATNVGVGTMVSSFRLTFTGWLDQRLPAELYVTARDDAQGADLASWLAPRVEAVLPIRGIDGRIAGWPARIYGIVDHPTYAANWPLLAAAPDLWTEVAAGRGALVNEQLARRADLWPGSAVALTDSWSLPVVGVYSDYGNPAGQAIVAIEALAARFPDLGNRQFGLRLPPEAVPDLMREMRENFDLPALGMVDQTQLKAASLRVFDTTFVVTGALNVLTLGVAGFAMLTSLLSLWSARLPQLAPVWAMGLTRARLARLELARSVGLAALTALVALPFGLLLAWALLAVINVEAFGWRLPLFLFPLDWLRLGALALLAAAIAAAIPVRRLNRLAPGALLKVFADER